MIVVTGASGFLGQHLVTRLSKNGSPIRAIYHSTKPSELLLQLPNVIWQQADLLDIEEVENLLSDATHVYHCAAIVSFDRSDKHRILQVNIDSTANVVNAALEANIQKLVYVSSVAALGRSSTTKIVSEETEWEESPHQTTYSKSKYYAELEVWRGIAEGLNAAILNPGIILGEGDWEKGSAKLIKTADHEFPFYTKGVNGWVDVKDVVELLVQLMNSNIEGERFVCCEGNHSYKDIFTMMAKALHKKPPHLYAGKFLTAIVWRWSAFKSWITKQQPTITKETAGTAHKKVYYDNQKILKAFPEFSYQSIQSTINRMAAAYLEHKQLN